MHLVEVVGGVPEADRPAAAAQAEPLRDCERAAGRAHGAHDVGPAGRLQRGARRHYPGRQIRPQRPCLFNIRHVGWCQIRRRCIGSLFRPPGCGGRGSRLGYEVLEM